MRRTIAGSVAAFAAVAIALTGCGGDAGTGANPKPSPSAEKPQDTATLLGQSFKKIETESFKFTSTMKIDEVAITSEGAFDLSKKLGVMSLDLAGQEMEMRILGTDMYVEVMG
ncbi:MAG: hypothetical protein ACRDT6_21320 [Micromonosporaceae bacterium]